MEKEKMEEDYLIGVSKKAVEHGLKVGVKVFNDKLGFKDKFKFGGASELKADIHGFIAECVVAEFLKQPFPELTKGKVDDYDLKVRGMRIDLKKVSYSKMARGSKILINKKQFERKKDKIDAFLFCNFRGAYEEKKILGYDIFVPQFNVSTVWLIGWIKTQDVERVGVPFEFDENNVALRLLPRDLKPIRELV